MSTQKFDAYIHVRAALEHVRLLLSPITYKQAESRDMKDMFLKAHPHMVKHMKLLRDSIEEESAFDFRRTIRNWYMNMAPWDRPRECEQWLPDFLGDKKFFDEEEIISTGFYFPGNPPTIDFYRTLNFMKRRRAPDTTIQPAPSKKMKPILRLSTLPSSDSANDDTQSQAGAGSSSTKAPPQAAAPVQSSKSSTAPNVSTSSQKPQAPPRRKQRVSEVPSRKAENLLSPALGMAAPHGAEDLEVGGS